MTLLAPFLASSFLFGKVCAEASDCHYVVNSDLLIILKITTPRPTLGQWPLLSFLAGFLLRLLWAVAWSHDLFMSCHWLSRWRRRRRRRRPLHGGQTTHTLWARDACAGRRSVGRSLSRCGSLVLIWVVEWDVVQCYQHVVCCWLVFCGGRRVAAAVCVTYSDVCLMYVFPPRIFRLFLFSRHRHLLEQILRS